MFMHITLRFQYLTEEKRNGQSVLSLIVIMNLPEHCLTLKLVSNSAFKKTNCLIGDLTHQVKYKTTHGKKKCTSKIK